LFRLFGVRCRRGLAANLHEYVEWGKNNVHDLLSSAHDWIDTVKVNGLRRSSADASTEKDAEDTSRDINEDSGDDKAAWVDGLDEDEDDEEDIKLTSTIKRRSLPDVSTTQQQENKSVVSDSHIKQYERIHSSHLNRNLAHQVVMRMSR